MNSDSLSFLRHEDYICIIINSKGIYDTILTFFNRIDLLAHSASSMIHKFTKEYLLTFALLKKT